LAAKTGFSRNDICFTSGFSTSSRQSYVMSTNAPSCVNVHTPRPLKSPAAAIVIPFG
jgi:hypothetical protein